LPGVNLHTWSIQDVVLLEPEPFIDHRGFFVRTFSSADIERAGIAHRPFVEESQSRSNQRVLRGLHGRRALSEGKLVRCARGEIFEAVLDLRPWSRTFLQWDTLLLDDQRHLQIWVPPGCVHGFQVLSEAADICYRMDAVHEPLLDLTIAFDDPDLSIPWPLRDPIVSERDQSAPRLSDVRSNLEAWFARTA
jgi:dTDP-4-dehydrorhamnose 3,5-epimerase